MVIDISEEELHQEVVTVRVKRILGTPPLQEAKEQFVDLVIQSDEYLGGASLYSTTSEVGSLVHTDGKVIKQICKRTKTKICALGFKSDYLRKVVISGSDKAVRSALEEIRKKFSKRITITIPVSNARLMISDGGHSLHNIEMKTGATVSVEKKSVGCEEDTQMIISGSEEAVNRAKAVVMDLSRIFVTNDDVDKLSLNKCFAMKEICRITKVSIELKDRRLAIIFGLKEAREKAIMMIRNM